MSDNQRIPVPPMHGSGIIPINNSQPEVQQNRPERRKRAEMDSQMRQPMMRGRNNNFVADQTIHSDITPKPIQDEKWARKQLTLYEAWTLKPTPIVEKRETSKNRQKVSTTNKEKSQPQKWMKVDMTRSSLSSEDIATRIKRLDQRKPITDKVVDLFPNQKVQVDNLLGRMNGQEQMVEMSWTLAQLDRKTKVSERNKKKKETLALTLYLKRSPKQDVQCKDFLAHLRRNNLPITGPAQVIHGPDQHSEQNHVHIIGGELRNGPDRHRVMNGGRPGGRPRADVPRQGEDNEIIAIEGDGPIRRRSRIRADHSPHRRPDDIVQIVEDGGRRSSQGPRRVRADTSVRGRQSSQERRSSSRLPSRRRVAGRPKSGGRQRRPSANSRNRRSRSRSSSSSSSSSSDSDCSRSSSSNDSNSTLPTSHSSSHRGGRSGKRYNSTSRPTRYHQRGDHSHGVDMLVHNGRGRRRRNSGGYPHVPDAPHHRVMSVERRNPNHDGDIFTAGVMAATRLATHAPLDPSSSSGSEIYDNLPSPRSSFVAQRRIDSLSNERPSHSLTGVEQEIRRLERDSAIRNQLHEEEVLRERESERERDEELARRLDRTRLGIFEESAFGNPFMRRSPMRGNSFSGLRSPLEPISFDYRRSPPYQRADPLATRFGGFGRRYSERY